MRKKILVLAMCFCMGASIMACGNEAKPNSSLGDNTSAGAQTTGESQTNGTETDETDAPSETGSADTESTDTKNTTSGEETSSATDATDGTESPTEAEAGGPEVFSEGLDDNGFLVGLKASDYVKLADYKAIKTIPLSEVKPQDSAVQGRIDDVLEQYATTKQLKDREVKDGDVINLDYTGYVGDEAFSGGSSTDYTYDPSKVAFIDGFYDQIIGHKPSEDKFSIEVKFPEDYQQTDLAGKDARFDIVLHYIEEKEMPELNDDFVKNTLKEEMTADEYRQKQFDELQETSCLQYVFSKIVEESKVEGVTQEMLDRQRKVLDTMNSTQASYYGMTLEEFYESQGAAEDDIAQACKEQVEQQLIMQAVAEQENIKVSDEEMQEYFGEEMDFAISQYGKGYATRMLLPKTVMGALVDQMKVE